MALHTPLDTYRFTTLSVPESERFDAWAAALSFYDFDLPTDSTLPFDAEFRAMRFGPFVLTSQRWLRPEPPMFYRAARSARKITADGLDYFHLMFPLKGSMVGRSGSRRVQAQVGALCVFDMSLPFDYVVATGDVIGLLIRRDVLQALDLHRLGDSMAPAMGTILAEYLVVLRDNMEKLSSGDVPYIARAAHTLLSAGLMRSSGALPDDLSEADLALANRARQFIDMNLQRADLTPEKISDAIGISRAKLYRLFQGCGGVMRQVQKQRLSRAYDALTTPNSLKQRIAQVARCHGFMDEKYFSRIFRATFGCTPREAMERRHAARFQPRASTSRVPGLSFAQWLKTDESMWP
ncbi:helix-turn-helix domain-containing protein [Burkholderia plantarii]|uniref:helix-turn-helix domain-containing protein n=1 Tax=Burkholderia plantarii TaxID=41899 RepID=UPI0018DCAF80|nr:helix-turn-helix domain-containing protein [Burkholderia plantarii]MBI0327656.1 helix-turn-helix domain-containing protein [Burkholderia plantarii]